MDLNVALQQAWERNLHYAAMDSPVPHKPTCHDAAAAESIAESIADVIWSDYQKRRYEVDSANAPHVLSSTVQWSSITIK